MANEVYATGYIEIIVPLLWLRVYAMLPLCKEVKYDVRGLATSRLLLGILDLCIRRLLVRRSLLER